MLGRLKKIIEREKLTNPSTLGVVLLFNRILHVCKYKLTVLKIAVTKDGSFTLQSDIWMCSLFPQKTLDIIIKELNPNTVLDVGCGTGVSLAYFCKNGIDAIGLENSALAISQSVVKDKITKHNLNDEINLGRKFDLVWCFEVVEHIHPDFESTFLRTLVNHSSMIILSAARPGQGGHGHFNEREPAYWVEAFIKLGYTLQTGLTEKIKNTGDVHSDNILCFKQMAS